MPWKYRISTKIARMATYLFAVTAVTACDYQPAPELSGKIPNKGDRIVMIGASKTDPQWPGIVGGARRYMSKYPDIILETPPAPDNRDGAMMDAVQQIIKTQPRVICLQVRDPTAIMPALQVVHEAGIHLITIGVRTDFARVFGHVIDDTPGAAELLGAGLDKIIGDKRSYMVLPAPGVAERSGYIYERFISKARSFAALTLLEEPRGVEATPHATVKAMFERFPNAGLLVTLDPTIWLTEDPDTLLGKNARFATIGASPALWKYLDSGQAVALTGPDDGELGALAMDLAIAALTDSHSAGALKTAPIHLVTRETLSDFVKRYADSTGLDLRRYHLSETRQSPTPSDSEETP